MKDGPPPRSEVQRDADGQHEDDEAEDEEDGAALVLSDLVVHAGVRVLEGGQAEGPAAVWPGPRRRRSPRSTAVPPKSTCDVPRRRRRPRSTRAR